MDQKYVQDVPSRCLGHYREPSCAHNHCAWHRDDCFAVPVGADYEMSFDDTDAGADFTGFTFEMIIQDKITGVTLLTLPTVFDSQTTGIYVPTPTDAEIFIQIRKADTVVVGKGDQLYNIRMTDPSGNESFFQYGNISFIEVD